MGVNIQQQLHELSRLLEEYASGLRVPKSGRPQDLTRTSASLALPRSIPW